MEETFTEQEMRQLEASLTSTDGRNVFAQEMMGPFKLGV